MIKIHWSCERERGDLGTIAIYVITAEAEVNGRLLRYGHIINGLEWKLATSQAALFESAIWSVTRDMRRAAQA